MVSHYLHTIVQRWRRSRLKITGITLKRAGVWTEVWATVDGEKTFLIREVYENDFHHSITRTGITRCRYDSAMPKFRQWLRKRGKFLSNYTLKNETTNTKDNDGIPGDLSTGHGSGDNGTAENDPSGQATGRSNGDGRLHLGVLAGRRPGEHGVGGSRRPPVISKPNANVQRSADSNT